MAQIVDLPTETLLEIFEYVASEPWKRLATLNALCRTCKTLCMIAQPILYNKFTIDLKESWREKDIGHRYLNFADTVARRPELRKSVTTLQLHLQYDRDSAKSQAVWVPSGFDLGGLRSAAPQYFSSNKKRGMWEEEQPLQAFPHVEMLLSIVPRLEFLRLKVARGYEITGPYLGLGPESAQHLANVKELVLIGPKGFHDIAKFEQIMPLIVSLPHLRKLKLKNFDIAGVFRKRDDREGARWHVAEGALLIEDLCIRNCSMRNEILQRIIRSCRRLTHFDYRGWNDIDFEDRRRFWREDPDVKGLHAALTLHKDSLQELSLNFVNAFEREDDYDPAETLPPYPPFEAFHRLKIFKIEYRRMRYRSLPPKLTYLYLHDCRDVQNDAEVEAWKAIKREFCPDIETFEIMCTDTCRCRYIQYQLKYMHFQWGCWTEMTREWEKDGFLLKVWFKDFIDGTYEFSQGSDDTGEIDSNGDKIEEENFQASNEDGDNLNDAGGHASDDRMEIDPVGSENDIAAHDPSARSQSLEQSQLNAHMSDDAHSSHTFDWVDELTSNFDEMDLDIDLESIPDHDTFEWIDELISDAEREQEEERGYPPEAVDTRAIVLAEDDVDDGWTGGEWRAPKKPCVPKRRKGRKDQYRE